MNRRDALKSVAAGIATTELCSAASAQSTSNTVVVAAVGCGGRGRVHARLLAARKDVHVPYVCDPDLNRANQTAAEVEKGCGKKPAVVQDIRRVLDDRSVG